MWTMSHANPIIAQALRQARLDALDEAEKALEELMDWADLTDCLLAIRALKEKT
jgi:hypothetical protein